MNEQKRDDYKFKINIPTLVSFTKENQPVRKGVSDYGEWAMFKAVIEGKEEKFFVSSDKFFQQIFKFANKGLSCTVTKKEKMNANTGKNYCEYEVTEPTKQTIEKTGFIDDLVKKTRGGEEDAKWAEIGLKKTRCAVICAFIGAGAKIITPSLLSEVDRAVNYVIYGDLSGDKSGGGIFGQNEAEDAPQSEFEGLSEASKGEVYD